MSPLVKFSTCLGGNLPNHLEIGGKCHKLWLKMFSLDIKKKVFFHSGDRAALGQIPQKGEKGGGISILGVSKTWLNSLS